jgi:AAA domain-containing protein
VATEPLRVVAASEVQSDPTRLGWLVEDLWSREGVGVIGGAPKCCKTWLGLDLAVSVAGGTPCLGRFDVPEPGPVLFYGAEDPPAQLRERIRSIASARGQDIAAIDIGLILSHTLRLDTERDRDRLTVTIERYRPRLLILDPLVRLHRIDENSAGEMSVLLGELRTLQRRYALAIILVHHLRKNGGHDGQALRGSGDLHAWGDSNLFVRRRDGRLQLTVEHRAAQAPSPKLLELILEPSPHLCVVDSDQGPPTDETTPHLEERILEALRLAQRPMQREALRESLRARNATLGEALAQLQKAGHIQRAHGGFALNNNA